MENEELTPLLKLLAVAARDEGMAAILFERVRWSDSKAPEAAALREALAIEARRAAAFEILNRIELNRILPPLVQAGHRFLLIKGTPLAYTLYPDPAQRVRCDTDVLVPFEEVPAFVATLIQLGYRERVGVSGELVSNQRMFSFRHAHVLDVHWKISNRPGFAEVLGFEELWAHSREVGALGPGVRAPDDVHALLLACLHLSGHHPGEEKLLWLYDIHLLANVLPEGDKSRFFALCREKGLADPCRSILMLTADCLPTPALEALITGLGGREPGTSHRPVFPNRLRMLAEDLRALPGWRTRLRLLRELAFPKMDYMRARYGVRSRLLLPYYYAKRALKGAGGWLRRS